MAWMSFVPHKHQCKSTEGNNWSTTGLLMKAALLLLCRLCTTYCCNCCRHEYRHIVTCIQRHSILTITTAMHSMQMPANVHIKILLLLLFYGLHRRTLPRLSSSSYPFFIFALSETIRSSPPAISQMLIQVCRASFLYFHISPLTTKTAYSVVPFF